MLKKVFDFTLFAFVIVGALFLSTSCTTNCEKCKEVPQNVRAYVSNASKVGFTWAAPNPPSNLPYLLTVVNTVTHQKLEVAIPAGSQTFDLSKQTYASFFSQSQLYEAYLQTDCRQVKGCKEMSAPSNTTYFWHTAKGGELSAPQLHLIPSKDGCFDSLAWNKVPNADLYYVRIYKSNGLLHKVDSTNKTSYSLSSLSKDSLYTANVQAKRNASTPVLWSPVSPLITICCILIVEEDIEILNHLNNNTQAGAINSTSACGTPVCANGQQTFEYSTNTNTIAGSFTLANCSNTAFWRLYARPVSPNSCNGTQNKMYVFGERDTRTGRTNKVNIRVLAGTDVLQYSITNTTLVCPSVNYQKAVLPFTGAQNCPL